MRATTSATLAADAPAGFATLWEQLTRVSFKTYRSYLGLPGNPVEFTDRYALSDIPFAEARAKQLAEDKMHFGAYNLSVADLTPRAQDLPKGSHPFPVPYVRRNTSLQFNIADYGHTLLTDFLLAGGVFSRDQLESYMALKWEEVYAYEHTPHPIEYLMYYSC